MALMSKGAEIASHLKKYSAINLSNVQNYLQKFHSNPASFTPTTQSEQDLINQVHWNIYYGGGTIDENQDIGDAATQRKSS